MGRKTCANASALNFDAQPEQVERLVNLIFFSEEVSVLSIGTQGKGQVVMV
jgi:hypothetical protein